MTNDKVGNGALQILQQAISSVKGGGRYPPIQVRRKSAKNRYFCSNNYDIRAFQTFFFSRFSVRGGGGILLSGKGVREGEHPLNGKKSAQ